MLTFPTHLFNPESVQLRLAGSTVQGGEALSGEVDTIRTDGGGYWIVNMTGIDLVGPDAIRAWRAWEAELDNGVTQVRVPIADVRQAPRLPGSSPGALVPTSSEAYFPEAIGFGDPWIVAESVGASDFRATRIEIDVTTGSPIEGGEHFAIEHGTEVGARAYRIGRVISRASATRALVSIRPPLREAVASGTALDFEWPAIVGTVIADVETAPDVRNGHASVSVSFRESFTPIVAPEVPAAAGVGGTGLFSGAGQAIEAASLAASGSGALAGVGTHGSLTQEAALSASGSGSSAGTGRGIETGALAGSGTGAASIVGSVANFTESFTSSQSITVPMGYTLADVLVIGGGGGGKGSTGARGGGGGGASSITNNISVTGGESLTGGVGSGGGVGSAGGSTALLRGGTTLISANGGGSGASGTSGGAGGTTGGTGTTKYAGGAGGTGVTSEYGGGGGGAAGATGAGSASADSTGGAGNTPGGNGGDGASGGASSQGGLYGGGGGGGEGANASSAGRSGLIRITWHN